MIDVMICARDGIVGKQSIHVRRQRLGIETLIAFCVGRWLYQLVLMLASTRW